MHTRSIVRSIVAAAVVSLFVTGSPSPASGSGPTIWVAQHNITHQWWGALRYVAEHDRPIVLTANEVCFYSLVDLSNSISGYGYGSANAVSTSYSSVCGGLHLFNAVFSQGAVSGSHINLNPPGSSSAMPGTEPSGGTGVTRWQFGVPCVKGVAYGYEWYACATHLNPVSRKFSPYLTDYSLADAQSDWLRGRIGSFYSGPRILGGDFNLRPRQFSPRDTLDWRPSWQESDDTCFGWNKDRRTTKPADPVSACTNTATALRNGKIDYVWASSFWFVDGYGVADHRCAVATDSDHCLVLAHFLWR